MERSYADHVKKNHIARSNEGTGVFFFFFFATLDEISCRWQMFSVVISFVYNAKDEIFYLLSFDICLIYIQNGISKIAGILIFLIRRGKNKREKCIEISER